MFRDAQCFSVSHLHFPDFEIGSLWLQQKGVLSFLLQEQIDDLVENKILEALCGSEITEVVKVS